MPRRFRFAPGRVLSLMALAAAVAWPVFSAGAPVRAQEAAPPVPETTLSTRMTPERFAALIEAARQGLRYMPGEVLVKFRVGVTPEAQQRALLGVRSQPSVSSLRWTGEVALLHDAIERDPHVLAAELRLQPEVEWAEPNYLRRLHRLQPDDPGFSSFQWNMRAIDMPRAWDINPGGDANLVVAIVDSGVTTATTVLRRKTFNGSTIQDIDVPVAISPGLSPSKLVSAVDLVSMFPDVVVDFDGHGTHVASTVAEDADTVAEVGVAYNVKIMPVKVCVGFWDVQFGLAQLGQAVMPDPDAGFCPDDAIADGIRYAADNGAKVINVSLGGPGESESLRQALLYAVGKGAFVAVSAGNGFEDGNEVEFPAAYAAEIDGVMSVGAIGPARTRAYYSGTASSTEIAAPGGDERQGSISSSLVWQTAPYFFDYEPGVVIFPRFDQYLDTPQQGTSMASPHVAGLAALLTTQGITSPAAVEALIRLTAADLGPAGRDDEYGYGLIQPRTALRGFGIFTE